MRLMLLAVLLALWGVAAHAQTQTLVDVATVSMSAPGLPRTVTDTVCATDGNDLVCDRGVYITSDSRVGVGVANPFVKLDVYDGAQAVKFRITDESLPNAAVSAGLNYAEFYGGGARSAIYGFPFGSNDFGLVNSLSGGGLRFHVSNTEAMRITGAGNVGIGTIAPSSSLHIYGPSASAIVIGRAGAPGNHGIIDYSSSTLTIGTKANDGVVFQTNGYSRFGIDRSGFMTTRGDVGINIYPTQPSASLHVSGTLLLANGGEACDANRLGAIRYTGGDFSFCRNGSVWETLTSIAGAGQTDRITSGTTAVVVNSATGIVSISQLGAVASYVHPSMGYVGPGVSATGTVSASKVATNEVFMSKTGGLCSTLVDEGRMFRNATTGRLQLCMPRN